MFAKEFRPFFLIFRTLIKCYIVCTKYYVVVLRYSSAYYVVVVLRYSSAIVVEAKYDHILDRSRVTHNNITIGYSDITI